MPNVFEQGVPQWGFIASEAQGTLSREQVTILAGDQLEAGTVMGERDDGKWEQLDPASSEGNNAAKAILCHRVVESESDRKGVVLERLAEVNGAELIWPDGITTGEQNTAEAELLARNIKIRSGPTTISTQTT